jgi:transcriptional regulator of acetoin/glycerol metabolism
MATTPKGLGQGVHQAQKPSHPLQHLVRRAEILAAPDPTMGGERSLVAQLEREEKRRVLAEARAACDGQVVAAAERLGASRATLYRRTAQLGLDGREEE